MTSPADPSATSAVVPEPRHALLAPSSSACDPVSDRVERHAEGGPGSWTSHQHPPYQDSASETGHHIPVQLTGTSRAGPAGGDAADFPGRSARARRRCLAEPQRQTERACRTAAEDTTAARRSRPTEEQTQPLNVKLLNVQSLLPKLPDSRADLHQRQPDVICLTESNLKSSTPDRFLSVQGYKLFRRDRVVDCSGDRPLPSFTGPLPVHYRPLSFIAVHYRFITVHYRSITVHCWSITGPLPAHYRPLSSITVKLSSITVHYRPLPSIVGRLPSHYRSIASITAHYRPLPSIIVHYRPLPSITGQLPFIMGSIMDDNLR